MEQVRLSTTSARQLAEAAPMLTVPLLGDLLEVHRKGIGNILNAIVRINWMLQFA
jgi:hypothetical protein